MKFRKVILMLLIFAFPIIAESEEIEIIENIELLDAMELLDDDSWDAINSEDEGSLSSAENK